MFRLWDRLVMAKLIDVQTMQNSSTVVAAIKLAQPRKQPFLLFLLPNNLKVISSDKAAKLIKKNE
jgi:hypothetical protein